MELPPAPSGFYRAAAPGGKGAGGKGAARPAAGSRGLRRQAACPAAGDCAALSDLRLTFLQFAG